MTEARSKSASIAAALLVLVACAVADATQTGASDSASALRGRLQHYMHSLQPTTASVAAASTSSSMHAARTSAAADIGAAVPVFPYAEEDGYGDYDLDSVRDRDTVTADMKKDKYKRKTNFLDDVPRFPPRRPVPVSMQSRRKLLQDDVPMWDPLSNSTNNMNEDSLDSFVQQTPLMRALSSVLSHDKLPQLPLVPEGVDPLNGTRDLIPPNNKVPLNGSKTTLFSSELPLPTASWKHTRFPSDDGRPIQCHSNKELRKYLDYVGIDKDFVTGVRLVATGFRNVHKSPFDKADPSHVPTIKERSALRKGKNIENAIRKDESEDDANYPDGLYYFWLNGAPDNKDHTRRCYSPDLHYEPSLDEIGPSSQEIRWGCTPFRVMGMELQQAVKCAIGVLGSKTWAKIEDDLLHDISIEAQRQKPIDFSLKLGERLLEVLRAEEQATGVKPTETRLLQLHQCFKHRQRALVCTPALSGSIGMNGHGLTDHQPEWVSWSMKTVRECHVPAACGRLVSERLMHFNLKLHQRTMPELGKVAMPHWENMCRMGGDEMLTDGFADTAWWRSVTGANDLFFSSCYLVGLKKMCQELPECCPTVAEHMQCRKDFRGEGCNAVCSAPLARDGEAERSPADMLGTGLDSDDEDEESGAESSESSTISRLSSVLAPIPPAPELELSSLLP